MCVCVTERENECVCVRERENECVCVCVCVCVCMCENNPVGAIKKMHLVFVPVSGTELPKLLEFPV